MVDTALDVGKVVLKVLVAFGALAKILYSLASIFEALGKLANKPMSK